MTSSNFVNSLTVVKKSDEHCPSTVLIVDDTAENIQILGNILKAEGLKVRKALTGANALRSIAASAPDLILLDIMMPEMDGFEVCQKIKANPDFQDIPIIFISALNAVEDKIKGFEIGGVDYIEKPFQAAEVTARVNNHLRLYKLQQQYQLQTELLQQKNKQLMWQIRERKLAEEKYQSIFEHANEGIFQTSMEGKYITANPKLAEIYGYESPQDIIQSIADVSAQIYVEPKRRLEIMAYLKRYGKITGAASQVYRKDGSTIWVVENIREVRDQSGVIQYYEGTVQDITEQIQVERLLHQARQRSEQLILNMLPQHVAQRLKTKSSTIADSLDAASILFADLVDFTEFTATVDSQEVVNILNHIFSDFDTLVERYRLQKIKTIGDAYMVAAGIPHPVSGHLEAIANLALDMQAAIQQFQTPSGHRFSLRIGLHSGPVIAGVLGKKALAYDVWGHAVNMASRMEETSIPGKIQVSADSYNHLKAQFAFEKRGFIQLQGIGLVETYFLTGRTNSD